MTRSVPSWLALLALGLGCDTGAGEVGEPPAPPDTAVPPTADVVEDTAPPAPDVPAVAGICYDVGINVPGKTSPDSFTALTGGANAPIVLGPQGSWMIVVAARTDGFDPTVKTGTIEASLTGDDGTLYGNLKFKKRPLIDGGDGFVYMMNIFLVVPSDADAGNTLAWEGHDATLDVALTPDGDGQRLQESVTVHLVKQL